MMRGEACAGTGIHRNAVVAVFVNKNLRDAAALAGHLLYVRGVYAFVVPELHAHAAEIVVTNAGNERHARALPGGSHRSIASFAARADAEIAGHQRFTTRD